MFVSKKHSVKTNVGKNLTFEHTTGACDEPCSAIFALVLAG